MFVAALAENGAPLPDRPAAAQLLKRDYARQAVSGARSPFDAAQRIVRLYQKLWDVLPPTERFVGDSFGIARLYGLYDEYTDSTSERSDLEAALREELAHLAQE